VTATDEEILEAARNDNRAVVTPDLDFSTRLALGGHDRPSLITLRTSSRSTNTSLTSLSKRFVKHQEGTITFWLRNDPRDQSDEAEVFGFNSSTYQRRSLIEQRLVHLAGKRLYDAIADGWTGSRQDIANEDDC
jgi:hypothetical protein